MNHTSPPDKPAKQGDAFWEALFAHEPTASADQMGRGDENGDGRSPHPSANTNTPSPDVPAKNPWDIAIECQQHDQTVRLRVTDYNKGGLIVYWNNLQGFVPASQLVHLPQFHIEHERIRALKEWVNAWLELKIIELNPAENRLIFSERAARVNATDRDQLLQRVQPGDTIRGIVTNLTKFGVFLDLGGVEGLIHISELSWSRVTHPSKVLRPGQQAMALVLDVDRENGRVALSLKRLKLDPWHNIEARYASGQIVEGIISNIVPYGAFVQLEDELEGLIHISELAEGNFLHPRDVVCYGERVRAKVLKVDGAKKRLALSLRDVGS
ncbi:MAG: S1 RNA-binding domain-containing protein [Ardenticatenaceae bacterium]|nr:S1 RNA-binding domain-containing protein [Anaerolineales bacterium]MCB8920791.1 S1 RNA-binding domain-containing protein [Ardenticatenaceae bacterium]MCB8989750.1 S1 RNA-binding domain-containing protein [Ardenticatenaceae bacterium]MCB9002791.1 S1 RNA-binding domain-containing protein [Ardenticatenaceae bacterium]